ncbi:hypothetical protein [Streptomyces sp. BE147]|uniref:hypothetical protein n=1 Tax=unclassified Streptomyces TaxID=2593676 RepID=UPI002E76ADA3|nr:hypothetical protein [Streptomyces sp. BE147]MEE1741470.1 hypothetical protein [Streptomyces sp. BE147]
MGTRRAPAAARAAAAAGAALALLTGCGSAGGLVSAGRTPSAVEPSRLWPDLPAASAAPYDYGEGETARIPGIRVPGGDVRALDPVAVVRAGLKARPDRDSGTDELPAKTVAQLADCSGKPAACPVLAPYFRDLTGDGRDELVLGITLPDRQLAVRVYMPDGGGLTRIMSTSDAVISVQIAGRDLIMRAPSAIIGYEYRTAWTWDEQQHAMLPARDEILRMPRQRIPAPAPSVLPSASPSAAPPAPPAASPSGSPSAAAPGIAAGQR